MLIKLYENQYVAFRAVRIHYRTNIPTMNTFIRSVPLIFVFLVATDAWVNHHDHTQNRLIYSRDFLLLLQSANSNFSCTISRALSTPVDWMATAPWTFSSSPATNRQQCSVCTLSRRWGPLWAHWIVSVSRCASICCTLATDTKSCSSNVTVTSVRLLVSRIGGH